MGRLSGFRYRKVTKKLSALGFVFDRYTSGSHEIWRHVKTGRKTTLPRHSKDIPEGTLRAILRVAGIDVEEFLSA